MVFPQRSSTVAVRFPLLTLLAAGVIAMLLVPRLNRLTAQTVTPGLQATISSDAQLPLDATLIAIEDGQLKIASDEDIKLVPVSRVGTVAFEPTDDTAGDASGSLIHCRLIDGSMLMVKAIEYEPKACRVLMVDDSSVEIAASSIASLTFARKSNKNSYPAIEAAPDADPLTSDAIVVNKNGSLQWIEGVVESATAEALVFTMGERTATVKTEKLEGVVFYRLDRQFDPPMARMDVRDGSRINLQAVSFDGSLFQCVTVSGEQLTIDAEHVASFDFSAGRAVWLSDLLPSTNQWQPLVASPTTVPQLEQLFVAKMNESFSSGPLTLKTLAEDGLELKPVTSSFEKGFAISGGGKIGFRLNRQFKTLTAMAGFSPDLPTRDGVVRLVIQVDGQNRFSQVMEDRAMEQPIDIEIDLSDADRLVIRVDYEDGRVVGDQIHLVNARVTR